MSSANVLAAKTREKLKNDTGLTSKSRKERSFVIVRNRTVSRNIANAIIVGSNATATVNVRNVKTLTTLQTESPKR